MSGDEPSTYAPKSPDLSSFYSPGPPSQHTSQFDQLHSSNRGPVQYHDNKLHPPPAHGHSYPSSSYAPPQPPPHQQAIKSEFLDFPPPGQQQYFAGGVNQRTPQAYEAQQPPFQLGPYGQPYLDQSPYPTPSYPRPYQQNSQTLNLPLDISTPSTPVSDTKVKTEMPPRRAAAAPPAPFVDPSPVRTKFPTARIKRIMQADEEVGKVAQQTPIAVGKALELFMVQMVSKSAEVAKEKGSRRVTASMLKQVVETDEQWDFLRDIVSRVENEKEGGRAKAKTESESEEEAPEPKKKGRGGKRKKA